MSQCRLCHNTLIQAPFKSEVVITSDHKILSGNVVLEYCVNCGMVFTESNSAFNTRKFYEEDFDLGYNELLEPTIIKDNELVDRESYIVEFVIPHIPVGKNKRMIDIGRGNKRMIDIGRGRGGFLQAFKKYYPRYELFGIEPAIIKDDKFRDSPNMFQGFLEESPYSKHIFDFISLINVLEHVEDPTNFLRIIRGMMDNNSILLIEVPNFVNNKVDILNLDHRTKLFRGSMLNLFSVVGFEIINEETPETTVSMRFLLKKGLPKPIKNVDPTSYIMASIEYIERVTSRCKLIEQDEQIFVYGFGAIHLYLTAQKLINKENIVAFINDKTTYWGKTLYGKNIIAPKDMTKYDAKTVLLAMNECYHPRVLPKIKGYKIIS